MRYQILGLLVAAGLFVGCSEQKQAETKKEANEMAQEVKKDVKDAAMKTEKMIDNAATTGAVKAKLAKNVKLSTMTSINVDSMGSTVTLTGTVPTKADKQSAETEAKSVAGVTRVINDLVVKPQAESGPRVR